jgi:hypothetical protein
MKQALFISYFLFIAAPLVWLRCSVSQVAGGGTIETTSGAVSGTIVSPLGGPGAGAQVKLLPAGYDPVKDTNALPTDTTDSLGQYDFSKVDSGDYVIEAVNGKDKTRFIRAGIHIKGDTIVAPPDTLRLPGTVKVSVPAGINGATGYFYIPGTTNFVFLNDHTDYAVLDSAPAGCMPAIYYSSKNGTEAVAIRYNVRIVSGDTAVIMNPSWKYARAFILNTSETGANVAGTVSDFPVIIRLNADNFDFSQAQSGGADIRFTKNDNTPLPYEIERWDEAAKLAEVWVRVDTVHGNDSMQSVIMYWGNPGAADSSSGAAVFDTTAGFQGVWHLSEGGDAFVFDATANRYDGTAYGMSSASSVSGEIGKARAFDGSSSYITMPNTKNSKLNFPKDSYYTVSAWVFLDTFDNTSHCIVSKGYTQYYLRSTYVSIVPQTTPSWEFVEFSDKWQTLTFPATGRQWTLLTGVWQGTKHILYCNGAFADSTVLGYPNSAASRDTLDDLSIGKFLKQVKLPISEGYCFFKGSIDEVRICSAARSLDWIKLCFMNQRADDRLTQVK